MAGIIYSKFTVGQLAAARSNGLISFNIRGYNPDVGGSEEVVSPSGVLFSNYTLPTTMGPISLVSTSTSDSGSRFLVQYLDTDMKFRETFMVTNGTTPVLGPQAWRVLRAYIVEGNINAGTISFSINSTTPITVQPTDGITGEPVFTVPSGYIALVNTSRASVSRNAEAFVYARARFNQSSGFSKLLTKILNATIYEEKFDPSIIAPAMTDIVLTATGGGSGPNPDVVSGMDLIMVPEGVL